MRRYPALLVMGVAFAAGSCTSPAPPPAGLDWPAGEVTAFSWEGPTHAYAAARIGGRWVVGVPPVEVDPAFARAWEALLAARPTPQETRPEPLTGAALGTTAGTGGQLTVRDGEGSVVLRLGRLEAGGTWVSSNADTTHLLAGDWGAPFAHDPDLLRDRTVWAAEPDAVRSVSFIDEGLTIRRGPAGAWLTDAPAIAAADRDRVERWLHEVTTLQARDYRPDPIHVAPTLEFDTVDGPVAFALGPMDADSGGRWIARVGVPGRFLLGPGPAAAVALRPAALRDLRVLDLDPAAVASVSLRIGGTGWAFQCESSTDGAVSCDTITGYRHGAEERALRWVIGLRARAWDDDADPAWAIGAQPDEVRIHLRDTTSHVLRIGRDVAASPSTTASRRELDRYARLDDGGVFRLDARLLASMLR